jgi:hypothetical protein
VTEVTFNGIAGTLGTQSDSYVRVVVASPNGAAASSFTFEAAGTIS